MRECWLRPNRRVIALGLLPPILLGAVNAALLVLLPAGDGLSLLHMMAIGVIVANVFLAAIVVRAMFVPRLAFRDGRLLVYLRSGGPDRVPIEDVEVFFLGQTESGLAAAEQPRKSTAVVVRLAESAKKWRSVPVQPSLGKWEDGYITIRGTWCEPITRELMTRLNERLREARRESAPREKTSSA